MRLNDLVNVLDLSDLADNLQFHICWGDSQHTLVMGEDWKDFISQTNLIKREVIQFGIVNLYPTLVVLRITLGDEIKGASKMEKQLENLTLRESDFLCEAVEGCTDCPLGDNGVCRDSDRWFEERTGLIGEIEELFPLMKIDFFEYNLHKNEAYLKITLIDGELENQRFLGSLQITYSFECVKHYDTSHYLELRNTNFESAFKYMQNKSFTVYQEDFSLALMERFINEDCDRLKTAFAEYKEIITKLKEKLGHHGFFRIS